VNHKEGEFYMNYWLFQIMYDWYPESWPIMVEYGVAAQGYSHVPKDNPSSKDSFNKLKQIKKGDMIVAAFTKHRFGGYGKLLSDFYRGGPSLNIEWYDEESGESGVSDFFSRFDCEWTVIPLDRDPPFINCHQLKSAGYNIDLIPGRCVHQIDEKTFLALKRELDSAGARSVGKEIPPKVEQYRVRKEMAIFKLGLDENAVQYLRSTGKIAMSNVIDNCQQKDIIVIRHSKAGHIVGIYEIAELEDRFLKVRERKE